MNLCKTSKRFWAESVDSEFPVVDFPQKACSHLRLGHPVEGLFPFSRFLCCPAFHGKDPKISIGLATSSSETSFRHESYMKLHCLVIAASWRSSFGKGDKNHKKIGKIQCEAVRLFWNLQLRPSIAWQFNTVLVKQEKLQKETWRIIHSFIHSFIPQRRSP